MTEKTEHKAQFYAFVRPKSGRGVGVILAVASETAKTVTGWSVLGSLGHGEGHVSISEPGLARWERSTSGRHWLRIPAVQVAARYETEVQAREAYAKAEAVPDVDSFVDPVAYKAAHDKWMTLVHAAAAARQDADAQWSETSRIQAQGVAAYSRAINQALGLEQPQPEGEAA